MKKAVRIMAAALAILVSAAFHIHFGAAALAAPRATEAAPSLAGVGLSAGAYLSPAFDPEVTGYTVTLFDYVGSVTITPQAGEGAAFTITPEAGDEAECTVAGASAEVSLASPADTAALTVAVTAGGGTARAYTLRVVRAKSVSLDLAGITYALGVRTNPVFSAAIASYQALVPYSMGSVTISVTKKDAAASVSIGGVPGLGRAVPVGPGATLSVAIEVSSPATTDQTKVYTVSLKRGTTLSGLTAVPKVGSTYTLSPGGTNRLTLKYTMNGPGAVKVEVQKGKKWFEVMSRAEPAAGVRTWDWDGRVSGAALSAGTYRVRVTPSAFGMTSTGQTVSVRVVGAPSLTWSSVASPFHAAGTARTLCKFKMSVPSNALVRVCNAAGKIVATAGSYKNLAPGAYKTVAWDGLAAADNQAGLAAGSIVPPGTYTVRITAGSKTFTKTVKIIG